MSVETVSGTDACSVIDEREFKFAINDMIAQATKP